jgi:hypothetical protein
MNEPEWDIRYCLVRSKLDGGPGWETVLHLREVTFKNGKPFTYCCANFHAPNPEHILENLRIAVDSVRSPEIIDESEFKK